MIVDKKFLFPYTIIQLYGERYAVLSILSPYMIYATQD